MTLRLRFGRVTAVLTDIEGTTTPISFVKDRLFGYARRHLEAFLTAHARRPEIARVLEEAGARAGVDPNDLAALARVFGAWMDQDAKIPALKELQGLMWEEGYRCGDLRGEIFPDAEAALRRWADQGISLAIYSSGSVLAQKLLFGHMPSGDLVPLFTAFFDTAVGPKRAVDSYRHIADSLDRAAGTILFLSDVPEELDAAADAGLLTVQIVRDGEGTLACARHPVASSFAEIEIAADAQSEHTEKRA